MRAYLVIAFLMIAAAALAVNSSYYAVSTNTSHPKQGPQNNGDTSYWTAWTPATDGGPWNGGYLLGTWGDAAFDGARGHILAMRLDRYDPASYAKTGISLVGGHGINTMTAWGLAGQNHCMNAAGAGNDSASSGFTPFSLRGKIYWPIQCQYDGDPFTGNREAIIMSPDNMKHWCNWANYQAGGDAGPNTCDESNWSDTGDVITGDRMKYRDKTYQAVQWTQGDYFYQNKMCRLVVIMWGQDTAAGPIVPEGVDPRIDTSYTYAVSMKTEALGKQSTLYCHRFPTAANPMDPRVWQHYNKGKWDRNYDSASPLDVGTADFEAAQTHSEFYSPDAKQFFMKGRHEDDILAADLPWGPYHRIEARNPPNANGFQGWIMATYTSLGGGSFKISHSDNGHMPGTDGWNIVPGFVEWIFHPVAAPRGR